MRKNRIGWIVCVCVVLVGSAGAAETNVVTEPFVGVRVIHSKGSEPREVDIWVAEIDPRAPGVSFLVTPSNGELPGDTKPQTVREFVTKSGAQIGVNGSFFSLADKGPDGVKQGNVTGLSVSNGDAYSPFAKGFEEAINISRDNVPTLVYGTGAGGRPLAKRVSKSAAIARRVKSPTAAKVIKPSSHKPGTVPAATKEKNIGLAHEPAAPLYNALSGKTHLVEDGVNVAKDDLELHPRTAAGITADGKLLLMTVDGREPGRSMGMTLGELGDAIIHFGARDAISFDGGGSTTFVMDDPATPENDPKVMNLPSDAFTKANEGKEHGKERAVANSLAVFAQRKAGGEKTSLVASDTKAAAPAESTAGVSSCGCEPRSRGCCKARRVRCCCRGRR